MTARFEYDRQSEILTMAAAQPLPVDGVTLPEELADWLGRLSLLDAVPLWYLVPDARMLPENAMRFFQVDPNWINCLIAGALSIGGMTSGPAAIDFAAAIKGQVGEAARTTRRRMLQAKTGKAKAANADIVTDATVPVALHTMSGFLFNSPIVAQFPRMRVSATDTGGSPLPLLRFERLTSSLLLALFEGTIANVTFSQPPEGVFFGLTYNDGTYSKALRNPQSGAGASQTYTLGSQDWVGTTSGGILAIQQLATDLQAALGAETFTSAEFALEMVQGVYSITFALTNS